MAPQLSDSAAARPMAPIPYRILRRDEETADTVTLELSPAAGGDALAFTPGQFNMLYRFGVGEAAISISGPPGDRARLVHTIRAVGATSRALVASQVGEVLGVRGPFGRGWPVAERPGSDVVIVAGGLGLAPVRPILYHVLAERHRYGEVALVYGTRSPADLLYQEELIGWLGRRDIQLYVTVDRADSRWPGHVGVVTRLLEKIAFDPAHTAAFVCGPEIMMRLTARDLQAMGVPPDRLYLSLERNMHCAIGHCGHCQLGPAFVCKDGPVFTLDAITPWMRVKEL